MDRFGTRAGGALQHSLVAALAALLLFAGTRPATAEASQPAPRPIGFSYETQIEVPPGDGPVHVFVPLPQVSEQQEVISAEIRASIPGKVEQETVYGNRFWHGTVEKPTGEPISVQIDAVVRRHRHETKPTAGRALDDKERAQLEPFLGPNERVVVAHEVLNPILAEIRAKRASESPSDTARAIYDWVVDNVEYKKVGTGWGNGDTFWACSERYGNCTDFHALFTSLARTEGIPSRFEIGFPVPEDREKGEIGGYHCWVQFYLPGTGWIPIDASEAFKHPERRDLFFGSHPADRIHFTTGRDLQLGPQHKGKPLNYFVYPYVEVGGKPLKDGIETKFRFETPSKDTLEKLAAN